MLRTETGPRWHMKTQNKTRIITEIIRNKLASSYFHVLTTETDWYNKKESNDALLLQGFDDYKDDPTDYYSIFYTNLLLALCSFSIGLRLSPNPSSF